MNYTDIESRLEQTLFTINSSSVDRVLLDVCPMTESYGEPSMPICLIEGHLVYCNV